MSGYLPDGCTQEDCDRAAGAGDEGYYCTWCKESVDDEHECPGSEIDESEECPHGVQFSDDCPQCSETTCEHDILLSTECPECERQRGSAS